MSDGFPQVLRRRGLGKSRDRRKSIRAFLTALTISIVQIGVPIARADPVDDVVEALKIRDYLLASEAECRVAARAQARSTASTPPWMPE